MRRARLDFLFLKVLKPELAAVAGAERFLTELRTTIRSARQTRAPGCIIFAQSDLLQTPDPCLRPVTPRTR
jgi:hypothetical protein